MRATYQKKKKKRVMCAKHLIEIMKHYETYIGGILFDIIIKE